MDLRRKATGCCLPLLCATLLTGACDGDRTGPAGAVEGTWELAADSVPGVFLRIGGEEIEVFTEDTIADCFDRLVYRILEADGVSFRIASGADTFGIELRRDDNVLHVTAFSQDARYRTSTVDPSTLPLCQPTNPNADCATLPRVGAGVLIEDSLVVTDAENDDGTHYDLYAIAPEAPVDLVITMRSTAVDSYLVLFDSAGSVLQFNDDASNRTLNARLPVSFETACHIVMATSRFADEFGAYELEVAAPSSAHIRQEN